MGKGLANQVGLTWATVGILALEIVHVQLVGWLVSNLIGPLYNRLHVCVLILCTCTEPVGFKLLRMHIVFVYLGSYNDGEGRPREWQFRF